MRVKKWKGKKEKEKRKRKVRDGITEWGAKSSFRFSCFERFVLSSLIATVCGGWGGRVVRPLLVRVYRWMIMMTMMVIDRK